MPLPSWASGTPPRPTPRMIEVLAANALPARRVSLKGETLLIDRLDAEDYESIAPDIARITRQADAAAVRIEVWLPTICGHLTAGLVAKGFQVALTVNDDDAIGPHHVLRRPARPNAAQPA